MVDTTQTMALECTDDAVFTRDRFVSLFQLFAKCHNTYNKAKKLSEDEIVELGIVS